MTFEAGAWHCFGKELLDQLKQLLQQHRLNETDPSTNSPNALDVAPSKLQARPIVVSDRDALAEAFVSIGLQAKTPDLDLSLKALGTSRNAFMSHV